MWYIVLGLVAAFFAAVAFGAFRLNKERDKHEKEIEEIKKKEQDHEKAVVQAVEKASEIKDAVRTGDHAIDIGTMSDKLHEFAGEE